MTSDTGTSIRIQGLVQGVGFRPTVWQLAQQLGLTGTVCNDGEGVLICLAADMDMAQQFVDHLKRGLPPLARLDKVLFDTCNLPSGEPGFRIIESAEGTISTSIVPDAATCPDCLDDVMSSGNRRLNYPFTNCTHCGPRLTITRQLPYDRANTSMDAFPMCPECKREYQDCTDRRFHAQPNACPTCGPQIWLVDRSGVDLEPIGSDHVIEAACSQLKAGNILAIKGLGGFHIACDAANEVSIARLRKAKRRSAKPLAVMVASPKEAQKYAVLSDSEMQTLTGREAPIILLDQQLNEETANRLAPNVAPGVDRIGLMLPYTPLHHLLLRQFGRPLVMTSGNLSGEPQIIDNNEALENLSGIVDAFLLHNRDIVNRVDDSVLQMVSGQPATLRRARGYAPTPLVLPAGFETTKSVLAMGAYFKATFCQLDHGQAIMSHHIGDLDGRLVQEDYEKAISLYRQMRHFTPDAIAVDLHPDYASTQLGQQLAQEFGCPLVPVQHHHAHIAACMAEHQLPKDCDPVIGVALDGLGLGDDGQIWGGEVALCDYQNFKRLASFDPVPLIGGDKANKEPWRNLFAHLNTYIGWNTCLSTYSDLDCVDWFKDKQVPLLQSIMAKDTFSPLSSSAGRLFDAVAACLGLCRSELSYEGEAAIALQHCAEHYKRHQPMSDVSPYPFTIHSNEIERVDWGPLWQHLLDDLKTRQPKGFIAYRFHCTIAAIVTQLATHYACAFGANQIVLTGGVFQNRLLMDLVLGDLQKTDLITLTPSAFPANDGGISLGQAIIAAN